jgi:hypothetical protein
MPLENWVTRLLATAACACALGAAGCDDVGGGSDGFEITQTRSDRESCNAGEQGTLCGGASAPAVTASRDGDEFAVLWDGNYAREQHHLHGRRFDAKTGAARSNERVILTGLPDRAQLTTAAIPHPAGDGYLAVLANYPSSSLAPWRVLSLGPGLELREERKLGANPDGRLADVVGNEQRREALVIETSAPVNSPGMTSTGHEIRALRVAGDGRRLGDRPIGASDWEQGFGASVRATHVPARGEYLVARLFLGGGVQRIDVVGLDDELDTLRVAGVPAVRGTPTDVAIAHATESGSTLLAWVEWQPDRSRRVVGALLDADGSPGPPFEIGGAIAEGDAHGVGLHAEAIGSDFFVSWTDGLMDGERRHERVTAERPGEGETHLAFEKPGPGESTESAVATSPLGTHLSVWTEGLRDLDGRKLRGKLGEL